MMFFFVQQYCIAYSRCDFQKYTPRAAAERFRCVDEILSVPVVFL